MIHYIKIANFGSIRDEVELNFEIQDEDGSPAYEVEMSDKRKLLKLAYIYGPNASGKTTVLQAIDFLRQLWLEPLNTKDEVLAYDPFLFRPDAEVYPTSIELSFYLAGTRRIYQVTFNRYSVIEEKMSIYRTHQPSVLFTRTTDFEKRLSNIEFGTALKGTAAELNALNAATLHNNTVLGAFQKTNVDLPDLEALNKWGKFFLGKMVHAQTDLSDFAGWRITQEPAFGEWINRFLNKADQNIRQVSVKAEKISDRDKRLTAFFNSNPIDPQLQKTSRDVAMRREIKFVHAIEGNELYSLPLSKESSGSVRYFGLGAILFDLLSHSTFVSIDELDTSLHADLMKYFLQLFLLNSGASQLLFTTHNLNLLEERDFIRRDALWFTEKDESGAVSLFSAADFDSTQLRKGASLINAYKAGKLGAKPNLGSPYITAE